MSGYLFPCPSCGIYIWSRYHYCPNCGEDMWEDTGENTWGDSWMAVPDHTTSAASWANAKPAQKRPSRKARRRLAKLGSER